jgi:hypothetical protein
MVLFFALMFLVSLTSLLVGWRRVTRGSQFDVNRIELFVSGEPIADHYRPLERLLQKTDWEYLASQPGMTAARIRQLRTQRRKLFRQYLGNLVSDFGALCFLVKALMIQSSVDRPDLARSLRQAKTSFYRAVVQIQLRLLIHAVGFPTVTIEVGDLTRALEALSAQARMLQLSSEPSFA